MTESRFGRAWTRFVHIFGLAGFAFAQPVLEIFGKSPETFIFRGAQTMGIVAWALLVTIVPPIAIWLVTLPADLVWSRRRDLLHGVVVTGLCILIALPLLKTTTPLLRAPLVVTATLAGGALAALLLRTRFGKVWLGWSWVGPVAFLLSFLLISPTSKLVRPGHAASVEPGKAQPMPVVFALFDEFPLMSLLDRSGDIDENLYPNFASLARDSTWYRNYTVTEVRSQKSIPTILSGRSIRDRAQQPVLSDHPDNLFTLLRSTHRIKAAEWLTVLCPPDACSDQPEEEASVVLSHLITDTISVWKDASLPGEITRDIMGQFGDEGARGEGTPGGGAPVDWEEAKKDYEDVDFAWFLEGIEISEPATLHFIHAKPPHYPWIHYPSGRRYGSVDRPVPAQSRPARWVDEEWPVEISRLRHMLAARYGDLLLGHMTERLRKTGLYDDALIVVTSDHGISLSPGGPLRALTAENLHEVAWVPLFIKAPGQKHGVVDERNLMAPDLLPTIADILGTEVPWRTDGTSALDPQTDRGPMKALIRYEEPPRYPWPEEEFSIDLETAQRRLRQGAFVPVNPSLPPRLRPYSFGPAGHLVGQLLADMPAGPPGISTVTIDIPESLESFDDVSMDGELPAIVQGNVGDGGVDVVVGALNGRIAGGSPIFSDDGGDGRFIFMIPDFYFRDKANDLQLFQLEGSTLRPLRIR